MKSKLRWSLAVTVGGLILLLLALLARKTQTVVDRQEPDSGRRGPQVRENDSSGRDAPPASAVVASERLPRPATAEEMLGPRDIALKKRVGLIERGLRAKLKTLSPAQGLAYLSDLLAKPVVGETRVLGEDHILKVLAAKYLCLVAHNDPSLLPAGLRLVKSLMQSEQDFDVRSQLWADLGGTQMEACAVLLYDADGKPNFMEGFCPEEGPPAEDWVASFRSAASEDSEVLAALVEASSVRDGQYPIALRSLMVMDSPAARSAVLSLFQICPFVRPTIVAELGASGRPEVIQAFCKLLPTESNPMVVSSMAQALAANATAPEGASGSLLRTFERFREKSPDETTVRSALVRAAISLSSKSADVDSLRVVALGLRDPSPAVVGDLVNAIVRSPAPDYGPVIQGALGDQHDPYTRELLGYAMTQVDPLYRQPNLFVDILGLRKSLAEESAPDKKQSYQIQLEEREKALQALQQGR